MCDQLIAARWEDESKECVWREKEVSERERMMETLTGEGKEIASRIRTFVSSVERERCKKRDSELRGERERDVFAIDRSMEKEECRRAKSMGIEAGREEKDAEKKGVESEDVASSA